MIDSFFILWRICAIYQFFQAKYGRELFFSLTINSLGLKKTQKEILIYNCIFLMYICGLIDKKRQIVDSSLSTDLLKGHAMQ